MFRRKASAVRQMKLSAKAVLLPYPRRVFVTDKIGDITCSSRIYGAGLI